MTLSGFDDDSSTAFPRLIVCELQVSGSTRRFTERPESPDFSSNTGFSATALLAISSSVRPANRACSSVPLKKEARLLGCGRGAFSVILQDLPTAGVTGIAGIDVSVPLGFGCCGGETALATALFQLATSLSRTDSIKRTAATDR